MAHPSRGELANIDRIMINQKRAITCIADLYYQDRCIEYFINLKIITVISLYIRVVILHWETSQKRHSYLCVHHTRYAMDITLPPYHLSLNKEKPSYKGAAYSTITYHITSKTNHPNLLRENKEK